MSRKPRYSIIVPVLHEQDLVNKCIDQVRRVDRGGKCEIIVVDGDPGRGTIDTIRDPDVRTLVASYGRARQMNAGAAAAVGEVLVFLHVDTSLPDTAWADIDAALTDPECAGGAFSPRFDSNRWAYRAMAWVLARRCRRNRLPFGDQAIFLRNNYFHQVGRYQDMPLLEDVELVRRIRRRGDRLTMVRSCAVTSRRRFEADGIAVRVFNNLLIMLLYGLGVSPLKLSALGYRRRS